MSDWTTWKRKAPKLESNGKYLYSRFETTDGRTKRIRLSSDPGEARAEHADLSRRFLAGDYTPPVPQPRGHHLKQRSTTMSKNSPAESFVWPIPLSAGKAQLELPTTDLSGDDLEVLQLSLNQFREMIELLKARRTES